MTNLLKSEQIWTENQKASMTLHSPGNVIGRNKAENTEELPRPSPVQCPPCCSWDLTVLPVLHHLSRKRNDRFKWSRYMLSTARKK